MLTEPTVLPVQGPILDKVEPRDDIEAQAVTPDKPVIIRLDQLSKDYIEAGKRHNVLNELNRQFYEGDFVCLLGKSGSGKSTLLNLISGIDKPTGGEVFIREPGNGNTSNGETREVAMAAMSDQQRTLFRRRNIGIIFQFFNLIPTLTVLENVTLPIELAGGKSDANAHALDLLDRVGLADRIDTYPDKLSGGEQQRVAIARALAHDPLLILADEPTGNLDEDTGESVLSLLLELTRDAGKTLFMATHAPDVARQADRVLHLEHGKLVSDRTQQ